MDGYMDPLGDVWGGRFCPRIRPTRHLPPTGASLIEDAKIGRDQGTYLPTYLRWCEDLPVYGREGGRSATQKY